MDSEIFLSIPSLPPFAWAFDEKERVDQGPPSLDRLLKSFRKERGFELKKTENSFAASKNSENDCISTCDTVKCSVFSSVARFVPREISRDIACSTCIAQLELSAGLRTNVSNVKRRSILDREVQTPYKPRTPREIRLLPSFDDKKKKSFVFRPFLPISGNFRLFQHSAPPSPPSLNPCGAEWGNRQLPPRSSFIAECVKEERKFFPTPIFLYAPQSANAMMMAGVRMEGRYVQHMRVQYSTQYICIYGN